MMLLHKVLIIINEKTFHHDFPLIAFESNSRSTMALVLKSPQDSSLWNRFIEWTKFFLPSPFSALKWIGNDAFFNLLFFPHIDYDKQGGGGVWMIMTIICYNEKKKREVLWGKNFIISLAPSYCLFLAYTWCTSSSDKRLSFMLR